MQEKISQTTKTKLEDALDHLAQELASVRSGRANGGIVENIKVSVYGQEMGLKTIATISTPDAKTIQIQPWDSSNLAPIEKAIAERSELGLNPSNDGHVIRINVPPMSEETRTQMVKLIAQKAEEAQISLRNARHDAINEAKAQEKNKQISQDELGRIEKSTNALIEEYQAKIAEMLKAKESELMQV